MSETNAVTFNTNVKFGVSRYAKGASLAVTQDEYESLLNSGVIEPLKNAKWLERKSDDVDLFTLSKEELDKINKPIIAAFLDKEEIEYDAKATKDELVALIVGE